MWPVAHVYGIRGHALQCAGHSNSAASEQPLSATPAQPSRSAIPLHIGTDGAAVGAAIGAVVGLAVGTSVGVTVGV
jgi:hypothetical protein